MALRSSAVSLMNDTFSAIIVLFTQITDNKLISQLNTGLAENVALIYEMIFLPGRQNQKLSSDTSSNVAAIVSPGVGNRSILTRFRYAQTSVSDPDSGVFWIRIRITSFLTRKILATCYGQGCGSGSAWIRIKYADPDPRGKILRKKQEKCKEISSNCNFILFK